MPRRELTHEERTMDRIVQALRTTPFYAFRADLPKLGFDLTLEELALLVEDNRDYNRDEISPKLQAEQDELQKWRALGHSISALIPVIRKAPKKKGNTWQALVEGLAFLLNQVQDSAEAQQQEEKET